MAKGKQRWPMWKIAVLTVLLLVISVALFWLSSLSGAVAEDEATEARPQPLLDVPTFVMILGVAAAMLAVLSALWLVFRIRESRIPPWERGKKKRRR